MAKMRALRQALLRRAAATHFFVYSAKLFLFFDRITRTHHCAYFGPETKKSKISRICVTPRSNMSLDNIDKTLESKQKKKLKSGSKKRKRKDKKKKINGETHQLRENENKDDGDELVPFSKRRIIESGPTKIGRAHV